MCSIAMHWVKEKKEERLLCKVCGTEFPENFPFCLKCGKINPRSIKCGL